MYVSGEKPGRGTYMCMNCHLEIIIDYNEELPECPNCGSGIYKKVD